MLAARSITASRFVRGALTYVLSPLVSAAVGVALATAIVKSAAAAIASLSSSTTRALFGFIGVFGSETALCNPALDH